MNAIANPVLCPVQDQPLFLRIPCGTKGVSAFVSAVRHDDDSNPRRVTLRERLPLKHIEEDGLSALIGRLPVSESRTEPHHDPIKRSEGMRVSRYYSQIELAIRVPQGFKCAVHQKSFYGQQKMHEVGRIKMDDGDFFARCFPIVHGGNTVHSQIKTDESRNNLYLTIWGESSFETFAIACVIDPELGAMLVMSKPYSGEVFVKKDGSIECPALESSSKGKTSFTMMSVIEKHFTGMKLPEKPHGYSVEIPLNLDALRRGTTPSGVKWAEVFIEMDSPARRLSFGAAKGVGENAGKVEFIYVGWDDLPAVGKIRRVPICSIVRGVIEEEPSSGRKRLRKVEFIPLEEMATKIVSVCDVSEKAYERQPEWLQKAATSMRAKTDFGLVFAQKFEMALAKVKV